MSGSFTPDIAAYVHRIGYTGPQNTSVACLSGILQRHVYTIPFENLEVICRRGISLAPADLERKLINERRGGYCFEHSTYMLLVLRELGFAVTPLMSRGRWNLAAGVQNPKTHLMLKVQAEERPWLFDTGYGGICQTGLLAMDTDAEQATPHETRRIVKQGLFFVHQARIGDDWRDVFAFLGDEALPIDWEMANWFTSESPQSRFRQSLFVARPHPKGRCNLTNRELVLRRLDGMVEKREIGSPDELLSVLADYFDLHFPSGTRFGTSGSAWPA